MGRGGFGGSSDSLRAVYERPRVTNRALEAAQRRTASILRQLGEQAIESSERRSLNPIVLELASACLYSDLLRGIACRYAESGSLKQLLEEFGELNEKLIANYVIQVLEGLDYLHHNDIVHRNLKAANIFITQSGEVKLSDVGVSLNLREIEHVDEGISCMPNWTAPEVIELRSVSTKSDIWSLGCTVIESLTGQPPYGDLVNALDGTGSFLYPVCTL